MEENCGKGNSALLAPPQLSEEMPYINIHLVENPSNSSSQGQGNISSTPINPNNSLQKSQPQQQNGFLSASNNSQGAHKHVSMRYNMEISANVSLISRSHSMGGKEVGLQSLQKEDLHGKVLGLLQKALSNKDYMQKISQSFKKMDKSMKLSIKRSRQSIASSCSQTMSIGSGGSCQRQKIGGKAKMSHFPSISESITLSKQNQSISLTKLDRVKSSGMSKSNRISLCDAMNVKNGQILKEIEPIQSTQSLQTNSIADIKSRHDLNSNPSQAVSQDELPQLSLQLKPNGKKISIMIVEQFDIPSQSSLFSEEQAINLSELHLPSTKLSKEMITNYFQTTSPFLTNLALCFFFKLLSKGSITLSECNLGWLLCISTVVAYKVYYDQTVQCLMQYFSQQLNLSTQEMSKLERWFLSCINYELVISSQQYQNMMMQLLSIAPKETPKQQFLQTM